jgi:hypothetical protein
MARYHHSHSAPEAGAVVADTLEAIAREGARRLLSDALRAEVDAYLERPRYAKGGVETGYRNGYGRAREVGIGSWSVAVRAPRVSRPKGGSLPWPRSTSYRASSHTRSAASAMPSSSRPPAPVCSPG